MATALRMGRKYRRPRRRRDGESRRMSTVLSILLITVPIAVGGIMFWFSEQAPNLEVGPNLCLRNSPLEAHTVVLLDRTDAYSVVQRDAVHTYVETRISSLPAFAKLSIHSMDADNTAFSRLLFSKCRPSIVSELYQTPNKVKAQTATEFTQPVQKLLSALPMDAEAQRTPILESLKILSLLAEFGPEVPAREIIIVSDMMAHTEHFSHYRAAAPTFDRLRASDYYKDLNLDLSGVAVKVLYLTRVELVRYQGVRHVQFWRDLFQASGARVEFHQVAQ